VAQGGGPEFKAQYHKKKERKKERKKEKKHILLVYIHIYIYICTTGPRICDLNQLRSKTLRARSQWHMSIISALKRLRQKDFKFEADLGYISNTHTHTQKTKNETNKKRIDGRERFLGKAHSFVQ
jgi:hypothetical protein